jgi:hypothetical protein
MASCHGIRIALVGKLSFNIESFLAYFVSIFYPPGFIMQNVDKAVDSGPLILLYFVRLHPDPNTVF